MENYIFGEFDQFKYKMTSQNNSELKKIKKNKFRMIFDKLHREETVEI